MIKKRIISIICVAVSISFSQLIFAQENIDDDIPIGNTSEQTSVAQDPFVGTFAAGAATPAPVTAQPPENLLSELKVYPTF